MCAVWRVRRTLEHVLNEDTTLGDLLLNDELLIIGGDEENHDEVLENLEMRKRKESRDDGGRCRGTAGEHLTAIRRLI